VALAMRGDGFYIESRFIKGKTKVEDGRCDDPNKALYQFRSLSREEEDLSLFGV